MRRRFARPAMRTMFGWLLPQRRIGAPADIAHAALFLAEATSAFVTGSVVAQSCVSASDGSR